MAERNDGPPAPAPADTDPDAPASPEEVAASQRLRDALAGSRGPSVGVDGPGPHATPEIELALALRAAWEPASLSEDENRAVLDVTPSAAEQEHARALREALAARREPRTTDHADVHLAHALRSAFSPSAMDEAEHRRIVDSALAAMPAGNVIGFRRRQTAVRVAFGAFAGGIALAATVFLVITSAPNGAETPLAMARTTQPLFGEPFRAGEASARIDRIASARASDFRDNRFTKWGVR